MVSSVGSSTGSSIVQSLTGSTVDINALAKSLVDATRAPQQKIIDDKKTSANNKISAIGRIYASASSMKSTLDGIGDPTTLAYQPATSNASKASFVWKPYYTPRAFDLSFSVKQLATKNSITLAGYSTAAGWPASGSLKVYAGSRSAPADAASPIATYDYADYTDLESLRDAINAETQTTGLTAVIMNSPAQGGGTTQYLSIARGTGAANQFYVATTDAANGDLASGLYVAPPQRDPHGDIVSDPGQSAGQDAQVLANGITYSSPTNRFTNLISGVNIEVKAATAAGETVILSTTGDVAKYVSAVRSIVAGYNDLLATITNEIKFDKDVSKRGGLANDFTARNFLAQLRRLTTSPITGTYARSLSLAEVGVKTKSDGSLVIDETRLSSIAANNPELLGAVVASNKSGATTHEGVVGRMGRLTDAILGPSSDFVKLYEKTNDKELPALTAAEEKLTAQMDALQARYLKQFTAMQDVVNRSTANQSSLTNNMNAWTASLKNR